MRNDLADNNQKSIGAPDAMPAPQVPGTVARARGYRSGPPSERRAPYAGLNLGSVMPSPVSSKTASTGMSM